MTSATTAASDKLAFSMNSAAIAIDASTKTVQRAIRSGELRAKVVPGRGQESQMVRILRADLEAWLEGLPDAPSN